MLPEGVLRGPLARLLPDMSRIEIIVLYGVSHIKIVLFDISRIEIHVLSDIPHGNYRDYCMQKRTLLSMKALK